MVCIIIVAVDAFDRCFVLVPTFETIFLLWKIKAVFKKIMNT